ncbi:hypothetical protein A3762_00045 [Oleiphilus sp. HI0125]|nr:hypothetical protein A3738_14010 [Oleiphilus sp. HI0066]KZY76053.1 hypothetical protein A3739_14245 [Oleiphilus sp. HI0067]KZZ63420.1 hypothetical protein A3762_00045 [Oleiphilus sp. HI0125]
MLALSLAVPAYAEMQALEDDFLSGVSGQSGITLNLESNTTIQEFAYFDDGNGIAFEGLRIGGSGGSDDFLKMQILVDILEDGTLSLDYTTDSLEWDGSTFSPVGNQARVEIQDIRFIEEAGDSVGSNLLGTPSLGGLYLDFELDGLTEISSNATAYVIDTAFSLTNGRLGYRTNGNEFFLDGMSIDYIAPDATLAYNPTSGKFEYVASQVDLELRADAIRLSTNANNNGVSNDVDSGVLLPSYGSLWSKLALSQSIQLGAGGRDGVEGFNLDTQATISSWDLAWGDDTDWSDIGYWFGALGGQGTIALSNLTVDVLASDRHAGLESTRDYGGGLQLGFDSLQAALFFDAVVLGETKSNIDAYKVDSALPIKSLGSLGVNLLLADGVYDSVARTNAVVLQAGGNVDAGYQGLRLDTQFSLISPNNESNLVYVDNGFGLMYSGLEAYVDGDITLDVTADGLLGSTQFYDGLRIGFEDLDFAYRTEGFRLGRVSDDGTSLKSQDLSTSYSIPGVSGALFGLGLYPELSGRLNGHITLGPGGRFGDEGITINADIELRDGLMATYKESDGSGFWLAGLDMDKHLRDMLLDVTEEGLRIYETESWSRLDVTDFRLGDRATGASFGRMVLETYEQGSERTISAGGAGAVCVGGQGSDSASCQSDGGRWSDRGDQGLTIASARFFKDSVEAEGKRNRFTWETGRSGEGTAGVVNDTGIKLVFDNFTTNDGDGVTDSFGLRTDQNIDVASAYVRKKSDGADSNGVVGNKGDVKVMNPDGTYRYVAPADLTPEDWDSLPVGLALRTRTQLKELDFGSVDLVHSSGQSATLLHGLKLQNVDITSDITMTPLD